MAFLQRVLKLQAALWAFAGAALVLVPGWLVEDVLAQPAIPDAAWLRVPGVMAIVLAMLMVLVAQRVTEVWWWAWAFGLLEAGAATICVLNAAFGPAESAAVWPWWVLGGAHVALGAVVLAGIGRASREKPIVP